VDGAAFPRRRGAPSTRAAPAPARGRARRPARASGPPVPQAGLRPTLAGPRAVRLAEERRADRARALARTPPRELGRKQGPRLGVRRRRSCGGAARARPTLEALEARKTAGPAHDRVARTRSPRRRFQG